MHPAQRQAIFAMIDSVENQLRYVKTLLAMEPETVVAEEKARRTPRAATAAGTELLTEEEEAELEAQLEAERKEALKAQAQQRAEWTRLNAIADEETPKPLVG